MSTEAVSELSRRERQRLQTQQEIKDIARQIMVEEGAAAISLRAIAGRMGVVHSALYRYFKDRDELITALIVDAFQAFADHLQAVHTQQDRSTHSLAHSLALAAAYRSWALAHRAEFQLIFGTPIPGYQAPAAQTRPVAYQTLRPILAIIAHGLAAGDITPPAVLPDGVPEALAALPVMAEVRAPDVDLYLALTTWHYLHSLTMTELYGQLNLARGSEPLFLAQMQDFLTRFGWRTAP